MRISEYKFTGRKGKPFHCNFRIRGINQDTIYLLGLEKYQSKQKTKIMCDFYSYFAGNIMVALLVVEDKSISLLCN